MRACVFKPRGRAASRIGCLSVAVLSAIALFTDCAANAAPSAAELGGTAAQLSDSAFAMLNGINGTTESGQANPMLGAMAGFAADAQALSKAIASSDHNGASAALGHLQSARKQIDGLIASKSGALPAAEWSAAKAKLDSIAASIPATPEPPVEATRFAGGSAATTANRESRGPRIEIESAEPDSEGTIHLRGYIRGSALTSAGIYAGERELKAFDVGHVAGAQRLNFDIAIEQLPPDMTVRAADADGRQAAVPASAAPGVKTIAPMAPPESRETSIGSGEARGSSDLIDESGSEVASVAPEASETSSSGTSTEEIPPLGMTSPSAAHLHRHSSSGAKGLRVDITRLTAIDPRTQTYEVAGQIAGVGIRRAGIYVDGTLAASISLGATNGADIFDFDQTFSIGGNVATIRVYATSGRYVEKAIPIATTAAAMSSSPMPLTDNNPNQIAIQIGALQPISAQVYQVTGTISGRNLASAGLYQNGAMVQQFATAAGLLSSLAPQMFRTVNFSAQFNRATGPAVVRVLDTSGHEVDQPLMLAGTASGVPYGFGGGPGPPPYGRTNPAYGVYNPNVTGFGSTPYGSSYGANPYGTNPYSTQPAPSGTKWWQQLLR
ncbi:MAG TPA: hypothetical protein VGI47_04070 [Candidatus Binataceae bacterium]